MPSRSGSRLRCLLFLALLGASRARAERSPCPQIVFVGEEAVSLSDVERALVCGDARTEGWKQVPLNQARYLLQAFLQQRGYHHPRFNAQAAVLEVDAGRKSFITSLTVSGLPPGIDPSKLRKIKGETLTPRQLDRIKAALLDALQNRGYACPEIAVTADAPTGRVFAEVASGRVFTVEEIIPARLEGVDPSIFNRYEAFEYGKPLDMRLLTLTSARTLTDSLFLSAYYDLSCSTAGLTITQRVVEGKPRLYKLGAGVDTEGLAIGKAQWKHSRLGMRVSTLEFSLFQSYRQQSFEGMMRHFVAPSSRLHMRHRAFIQRRNELRFESVNAEVSVLPATSWDNQRLHVDLSAGPAFEYADTLRGQGPSNDTFLSLNAELGLTSHLFEYYARDPRTGWHCSLASSSRIAGAFSSLAAHRLVASWERLWNLGSYEPALLILGARGWAATTIVSERAAALRDLPPSMRLFLGGDTDLRGAARQEIPGDAAGFLTGLYDGIELRLGDVLPHGLQPLTFIDGAMAGRSDLRLDPDVYWSPGFGLRWASPIGTIRSTAARGQVWRRERSVAQVHKPHWQFFFSFGREF